MITGKLTRIDPSRKCLKFLEERIESDNYRGIQLSQHNRYDIETVIVLLEEMYNIVKDKRMIIRTTDLKKRPYNTEDEIEYANYTKNVNEKLGRCTQDSIRKNLFVELHRMGFIDRITKNNELIDKKEKKCVKYVRLTKDGLMLINTKNIFNRNFLYTRGLERLTSGFEMDLLSIIMDLGNKIDLDEFMLFVSILGCKVNDKIYTNDDVIELVKEYRSMSKAQRKMTLEEIKLYCIPDNFESEGSNKNDKRDFDNWRNEAMQIFDILNQTVLFESNNNILYIKCGSDSIFQDEMKINRSKKEKDLYFEKHRVDKKSGFQLHHVVPLFTAKNSNEYSVLDSWQNMIYIDAYNHCLIHSISDTYIKFYFKKDDMIIKDLVESKHNKDIELKKDDNIAYNIELKEEMEVYNKELNNSI